MAPWADALYACDYDWWKANAGVPEFAGLKISQDVDTQRRYPEVKKVDCVRERDDILLTQAGRIGWGGNSGFHALNLAAQFAASKIILVGYDMRLDQGLHWHGKHPNGQNNPLAKNIDRWRKAIDQAAPVFEALGVPVINASSASALMAYPKMTFREAMRC